MTSGGKEEAEPASDAGERKKKRGEMQSVVGKKGVLNTYFF